MLYFHFLFWPFGNFYFQHSPWASPSSLWWLKVPHVDIQSLNYLCRQLMINQWTNRIPPPCFQSLAYIHSCCDLIKFTSTSTWAHITSKFMEYNKSINTTIYIISLLFPKPLKKTFFFFLESCCGLSKVKLTLLNLR